jgi:hypothetical protein
LITTAVKPARASGTFTIGGDLTVNRLSDGAMQFTGKGVRASHATPTRRCAC